MPGRERRLPGRDNLGTGSIRCSHSWADEDSVGDIIRGDVRLYGGPLVQCVRVLSEKGLKRNQDEGDPFRGVLIIRIPQRHEPGSTEVLKHDVTLEGV